MPGIKLVIPYSFTDKKLPVLRVDDALPGAGALLLYDATHAAGRWGGGARNGLSIPNVAAEQARALTGSDLTGSLEMGSTGPMTVARTGKGGLHAAPSAVAPLPAGNFVQVVPPAALAAYLIENPGHSYYFSQWTRGARQTPRQSGVPAFTAAFAKGGNSFLLDLYRNGDTQGTYPNGNLGADVFLGAQTNNMAEGEPARQDIAVAGWFGPVPAAASEVLTYPFMLGRTGPAHSQEVQPEVILYRVYLEDLTVSGRSYAQASEADDTVFRREVLTSGGRYSGDSY